jgi:menaquinone-dependent protoporphyrinogen IX oxidase
MNPIVCYRSKTGYTKTYAHWIAKLLSCPVVDLQSDAPPETLEPYDSVIYGGGLYAVGIHGLKEFCENYPLDGKKLVVFATGVSPWSDEVVRVVREANLDHGFLAQASFYYFRGGFDFRRLPAADRFLMRLLKLKITLRKVRGKNLTDDEKGMLAVFDHAVDFTRQTPLRPLIQELDPQNPHFTESTPSE